MACRRRAAARPCRHLIQPSSEVLPRWHRGFETAMCNPFVGDAFRFVLNSSMRLTETIALAWTQVDKTAMTTRIEDANVASRRISRHLPVLRDPGAPDRRPGAFRKKTRSWGFFLPRPVRLPISNSPSISVRASVRPQGKFLVPSAAQQLHHCRPPRAHDADQPDRVLGLHAPSQNITEGYADDWTIVKFRATAQRITDGVDELTRGTGPPHGTAPQTALRPLEGSTTSS